MMWIIPVVTDGSSLADSRVEQFVRIIIGEIRENEVQEGSWKWKNGSEFFILNSDYLRFRF